MNKSELVSAVKAKLGSTVEVAEQAIEAVTTAAREGAKADGKCTIPNLGKVYVEDVAEKSGTSFGKPWTKPAHKKFKFEFSGTADFLNS